MVPIRDDGKSTRTVAFNRGNPAEMCKSTKLIVDTAFTRRSARL